MTLRVGVLGASGYAGGELLRILGGHPAFEVAVMGADRLAGAPVASAHPHLWSLYGERRFDSSDPSVLDGCDVAFLALPSMVAAGMAEDLLARVGTVVDLSADFRLKEASAYELWYGGSHPSPKLLSKAVYGLPELAREPLAGAELVAAPGCYVTAASLALAPLVREGLVEAAGIVVDAASGVSGAGRELRESSSFCSVDGDFCAYNVARHRHTPEMEQVIGAQILFTPHLAPMTRGILATCYARPTSASAGAGVLDALRSYYVNEAFVGVSDALPSTKATLGSNSALISARHDERSGWVVVLCALDNLVKGAAGQAVQCANIACRLEESAGLSAVGLAP